MRDVQHPIKSRTGWSLIWSRTARPDLLPIKTIERKRAGTRSEFQPLLATQEHGPFGVCVLIPAEIDLCGDADITVCFARADVAE